MHQNRTAVPCAFPWLTHIRPSPFLLAWGAFGLECARCPSDAESQRPSALILRHKHAEIHNPPPSSSGSDRFAAAAALTLFAQPAQEDDDALQAETYIKKAAPILSAESKDGQKDEALELQFKTCYARILDSKVRRCFFPLPRASHLYFTLSSVLSTR